MTFLHKSLDDPKFFTDRKLALLRNGTITLGQFSKLIDPMKDGYIMVGPAIVAKDHVAEFIRQWKDNVLNAEQLSQSKKALVTQNDIITRLPQIVQLFPQVSVMAGQFQRRLQTTSCTKCVRNHYVSAIVASIRPLVNDGRDLGQLKGFFQDLMNSYYPLSAKIATLDNFDQFDVEWVKPDTYVGLGDDLIEGLTNCFECTKKHLGRAKILYQEYVQGYPEHGTLMFREFTKANRDIQEAYVYYYDSIAQLDMASCQLVGNIVDLDNGWQVQIIQLANQIRSARILFQQDSTKVPDWDGLRIRVQVLQNMISGLKNKEIQR